LSHVTSNDKPEIARDDFPAGLPVHTKLCEMHVEIKSLKRDIFVSQASHWADIGKAEQCMSIKLLTGLTLEKQNNACLQVCLCECTYVWGKTLAWSTMSLSE